MKVGIIGLLPRQQALIQSQFPYLDFSFVTAKKLGGVALRRWSEGMDRIYTMTKFISHTDSGHVDKNKSQLIKGGISALARYLKQLPKPEPKFEKPKITLVYPPAPEIPTTPLKEYVMKKPTAKPAATSKTPEPYVIRPNEDGRYDWTILRAAKQGDRIEVPVPKGVEPSRHFARVSVMKSGYKRNYGVEMSVQYLPDRVLLEVLSNKTAPQDKPAPQPDPNVVEFTHDPTTNKTQAHHAGKELDLNQPLPEHLRLMTASLQVPSKYSSPIEVQAGPFETPAPRDSGMTGSSHPCWQGPHMQNVPPSQNTGIGPSPSQVLNIQLKNPDEISLWKEVLLMEGGKGRNMELSAKIADQAVAEYRRRLGS